MKCHCKTCTDTPQHTQYSQLRCRRSVASRNWVYMWSTTHVHIYKGAQLKSKLQYIGTWSAGAWPPRRLCYRPAVLFCLHATALSPCFKNVTSILCFFFLCDHLSLTRRNLKWLSRGVCVQHTMNSLYVYFPVWHYCRRSCVYTTADWLC